MKIFLVNYVHRTTVFDEEDDDYDDDPERAIDTILLNNRQNFYFN